MKEVDGRAKEVFSPLGPKARHPPLHLPPYRHAPGGAKEVRGATRRGGSPHAPQL